MSEIPRGPGYRGIFGRNTVQFRFAGLASALVASLIFSALPAKAAITHTTSNLNLRAGPGTHHKVKAIILAGAAIDIESCGHTWCYMAWGGHVGYVKHQYLKHHVICDLKGLRSFRGGPPSSCDDLSQSHVRSASVQTERFHFVVI